MSKKSDIEKKTREFILPILEKEGFYLYDLEYTKQGGENHLTAYIDKDGGITIDDCVLVSRQMNEILDNETYISEAYIFEVSSPGIERRLKYDEHFEAALGSKVNLKLYRPVGGSKEFSGILEHYDKDSITVETEPDEIMKFERKAIAVIRMAAEW